MIRCIHCGLPVQQAPDTNVWVHLKTRDVMRTIPKSWAARARGRASHIAVPFHKGVMLVFNERPEQ